MSEAAVDPALTQLAWFWANQSDAIKLIFNQLYAEQPEAVLRVLTQGQLVWFPGEDGTLDDLVAKAGGSVEVAAVAISEITIAPPYPKAGEEFTVSWTRYVTGPIPEHSDAVQIIDRNGESVDERPDARPAVAGSASDTQTMTFPGLPLGTYTVAVWANLEGGDGSGVPTAQGMRGQGSTELHVGDTATAQTAQQRPVVGAVQGSLSDAAWALDQLRVAASDGATNDAADQRFRGALQAAARALAGVDSLGDGFKNELARIDRLLERELDWTRLVDDILPAQQRLNGLVSTADPESPGDLGFALIDIVDGLY